MLLEIRQIIKQFDRPIFHLDSMSMDRPGILHIKGESGLGKSTLLRMIAGLDCDFEGDILIHGQSVKKTKPVVSYLTQDVNLIDNQKVSWHYKIVCQNYPEKWQKQKDLVTRLQLEELDDLYPDELSNGEKKRVLFVLICLMECDLWLLDEPFADLDKKMVEIMKEMIETESHTRLILLVNHLRQYHFAGEYSLAFQDRELIFQKPLLEDATIKDLPVRGFHKTSRPLFRISFISTLLLFFSVLFAAAASLGTVYDNADYFVHEITERNVTMFDIQLQGDTEWTNNDIMEARDIATEEGCLLTVTTNDFTRIAPLNSDWTWTTVSYYALNTAPIETLYGSSTLSSGEVLISDMVAQNLLDNVDDFQGLQMSELIDQKLTDIISSHQATIRGIVPTSFSDFKEANSGETTGPTSIARLQTKYRKYYSFVIIGSDERQFNDTFHHSTYLAAFLNNTNRDTASRHLYQRLLSIFGIDLLSYQLNPFESAYSDDHTQLMIQMINDLRVVTVLIFLFIALTFYLITTIKGYQAMILRRRLLHNLGIPLDTISKNRCLVICYEFLIITVTTAIMILPSMALLQSTCFFLPWSTCLLLFGVILLELGLSLIIAHKEARSI